METMTYKQFGTYKTITAANCSFELYVDFHNKRIKLVRYEGDLKNVVMNSIQTCEKYNMGKIIAVVNEKDFTAFRENGFVLEGVIEGYLRGETGLCASFFSDPERAVSKSPDEEDAIIDKVKEYKSQFEYSPNSDFKVRTAGLEDVNDLAYLFDTVFKSYPTPMDNPEYIKNVIRSGKVIFKIAEWGNKVVSAASADLQPQLLNAEITDCATLEEFRGKGLLSELIYHLEILLQEKKYITLFSLSRSLSTGINIVLGKHGYLYSGRLINNCDIMGKFEDMNIWVKKLR